MHGQIGGHDFVFTPMFGFAKNVAGRFYLGRESSQGGDHGSVGKHLVAKAAAGRARIAKDLFTTLVLDEGIVAFGHLEIVRGPHAQLHRRTRLDSTSEIEKKVNESMDCFCCKSQHIVSDVK